MIRASSPRPALIAALAVLVAAVFAWLAMARPIDHDESQYVAAAVLTARGLMPFRDYAYLQTPLQPFVLAPVAWVAGAWAWPALRLANALLGLVAVGCVGGAARAAGASPRLALVAAALFACCDIFLFSIGTARNDALPCALYAAALWLIVRGREAPGEVVALGLLLAAAAAAKISYALPVATYGLLTLGRPRRAIWLMLGALPVAALVLWTFALAPAGFLFGTLRFPSQAPAEYYLATGRAWKLGGLAKAVDTLKFLALGPALPAVAAIAWRRPARPTLLDALILAGLLSALLPSPTWRQYLQPVLPPLFVRLALAWTVLPPRRVERIATAMFAIAGLAPSIVALAAVDRGMTAAMRHGRAIAETLHTWRIDAPVIATLAPQFLPAAGAIPDPRFAAGPFYFRSHRLVRASGEPGMRLVSRDTLATQPLPRVILTGGEGAWTSGDASCDAVLAREAARRGYRSVAVAATPFRLWVAR